MATIKNSGIHNTFGGGLQKTVTSNSGKSYTIRNTGIHNSFGGGQQQEIVENNTGNVGFGTALVFAAIAIVGGGIFFFIVTLILKLITAICC